MNDNANDEETAELDSFSELTELLGEDNQETIDKILESEWLAKVKKKSYNEGTQDALNHARQVISGYVATAEKWRYDRVLWAFAIMLGEIPEDSPEPRSPADDEMDRMRRYRIEQEERDADGGLKNRTEEENDDSKTIEELVEKSDKNDF